MKKNNVYHCVSVNQFGQNTLIYVNKKSYAAKCLYDCSQNTNRILIGMAKNRVIKGHHVCIDTRLDMYDVISHANHYWPLLCWNWLLLNLLSIWYKACNYKSAIEKEPFCLSYLSFWNNSKGKNEGKIERKIIHKHWERRCNLWKWRTLAEYVLINSNLITLCSLWSINDH